MSIQTHEEYEAMSRIGRVVRFALEAMKHHVQPGITTAELDAIGRQALERHGARSAPQAHYGFPGINCISLNDEAVHGIPGRRILHPGDLVKLDVTAELDGYIADAALTVALEPISPLNLRLCECAESAFHKAVEVARAGLPIREIGRAMEKEVKRYGFSVLRELHSHGVGRAIHEHPTIPNYFDRSMKEPLSEGMVITLEPIIAAGRSGRARLEADGWTVRTADGSLSAHFEQTVMVKRDGVELLTA